MEKIFLEFIKLYNLKQTYSKVPVIIKNRLFFLSLYLLKNHLLQIKLNLFYFYIFKLLRTYLINLMEIIFQSLLGMYWFLVYIYFPIKLSIYLFIIFIKFYQLLEYENRLYKINFINFKFLINQDGIIQN